ncbi:MAG TPA: glycosyltransferase family 39 protein [Solirubrobacteraceae bacterium]
MSLKLREHRGTIAGLLALLAVSIWLRSTALHAPFWIDEGLSVGIGSHPFFDIPGVLRQDGSPPLYYLLLHVWMEVFSDGQATTHMLSLIFALLTVPAAFWAGRSLFNARSGWIAAGLAAINPFLTYYAQETRMYSLVALEALVLVACFTHAFAFDRKQFRIPAGLALAALIYTHNWGLFLGLGTAVALLPLWRASEDRRAFLKDAAVTYGTAAVLYLPWVPSLLFQAAHTGAPWSERPSLSDVLGPISGILGGEAVPLGLFLAAGAGLATALKQHDGHRARAIWMLVTIPLAGLAIAWLQSQASPAFTGRYFAVFVGPVILLAGIGLAHAGRLGIVCLAIVVALWLDPRTDTINRKSDARLVASLIKDHVAPGDLVISAHPEQAPLLHYYFPKGLRYATALGPMPDPQVFDWRDALDKLRAAHPPAVLSPLVSTMKPGQRVVLVLPIIRRATWNAPWTRLVRRRSAEWERAANRDPQLQRGAVYPEFENRPLPRGVRAIIYRVTCTDARAAYVGLC